MCGGAISQISNNINSTITQAAGTSNPFQDLGTLARTTLNLLSPIVGIGNDGKPQLGYAAHWLDEGIGQLTGRNDARDATASNRAAVSDAAAAQNSLIMAQRKQRQNNDVSASNAAGGFRTTAAQRSSNPLGFSSLTPASSGDYLGL